MSTDTQYKYAMLRAFGREGSNGNPAACIYIAKGEHPLNDDVMQKIAFEHKGYVSEVVFCQEVEQDKIYHLRYFSSECEVDFCGHGTIACMYFLIKSKNILHNELTILTNKGELLVY